MIAGIDLGGTRVRLAVRAPDGRIGRSARALTADLGGPAGFWAWVRAAASRLARERVVAVGVSAPGPLDARRGVLLNPPNLRGWPANVHLAEMVADALEAPVWVEKDTNLAALAEHRYGAGRGAANLVYLTWSTGIGSGLVLDGQLRTGAHGTAGEIGHISLDPDGPLCLCGQRGCLEMWAGGSSLERRFGRPAVEIFRAAAAGDPVSAEIVAGVSRWFGVALVNLANLIDPELIIVGGGVTGSWGLVRPVLVGQILASPYILASRRPRLVRAALGDRVGVVGAIEWARGHA